METLSLEQESDLFVAIGYNWSFTPPILQLKQDIQSFGVLSAPIGCAASRCGRAGEYYAQPLGRSYSQRRATGCSIAR
ncbi:MAG: hypothetical protein R2856_09800 [Caldilineaceae bacterium]